MGHRLPPKELELYKRCDEVLFYLWDPIGVRSEPAARDEYEVHLPKVFEQVRDDVAPVVLQALLVSIVEKEMQYPVNLERERAVANTLLQWRALIWERFDAMGS